MLTRAGNSALGSAVFGQPSELSEQLSDQINGTPETVKLEKILSFIEKNLQFLELENYIIQLYK